MIRNTFLVLTENVILYSGISGILKEYGDKCLHLKSSSTDFLDKIQHNKNIAIFIDCMIFINGVSSLIEKILRMEESGTTVVWLVGENTGRILPKRCGTVYVINENENINKFRCLIDEIRDSSPPQTNITDMCDIYFTRDEQILLNFFIISEDLSLISKITGRHIKSLYNIRRKIMLKTGFRQWCFFHIIYIRNDGIAWINRRKC